MTHKEDNVTRSSNVIITRRAVPCESVLMDIIYRAFLVADPTAFVAGEPSDVDVALDGHLDFRVISKLVVESLRKRGLVICESEITLETTISVVGHGGGFLDNGGGSIRNLSKTLATD